MLPSRIMDGTSGEMISEEKMIDALLAARAIYVARSIRAHTITRCS